MDGRSNSLAVFNQVLFNGSVLRTDIARRTNLTAASISRITRQLIDAGLIEECEEQRTGRPGRSHVNLRIREDAGYVIGVSVNAFEQRIAIATLQRKVIAEDILPHDDMLDCERASETAALAIRALLRKHRIPRSRVMSIGVASAGVVDSETGTVIRAPTIGWRNVPLGSQLEERLGIPVRVHRFVDAVAAAEYRFGAAMTYDNFIVVHATLGTGLGIVADGRPIRGHHSHAGLVGHLPLSGSPSPVLDDMVGGAAIYAKWTNQPPLSPTDVRESHIRELIQAANAGEARATAACAIGGDHLGRIVGTIATALDTEAVLLMGPMIRVTTYRSRLETAVRTMVKKPIQITVSDRKGVEAAFLLAITELAASGVHLNRLLE